MSDYMNGKVIVVTGAASGFGKMLSEKAASMGAKLVCADVAEDALNETVAGIATGGNEALAVNADVTDLSAMHRLVDAAVRKFGRVDVIVNNAGIMPLGFFSEHENAAEKWHACIDINFKGVLNGMIAVHDQMMSQGEGQIVNLSSIYGNNPVLGAAVYGATKAAVNYLSGSFRVETRGKVKVTTIKPTGVPATGIGTHVVNQQAVIGIIGQNIAEFGEVMSKMMAGEIDPAMLDHEQMNYIMLDPVHIVDQILHVINQPKGVSISDVTVRAAGDHYVI